MLVQPRTATWVQIPGLPFADCVTLIKSLPLSETLCARVGNGNENSDYLVEFSI